jgi:phosphoglycolate phosphatase-like HAD superfamily hydrolase
LHEAARTDSELPMNSPRMIVFDLDGTLVDTAPDLISALNYVLDREGLPPVPLQSARNMIGAGARKLIERGLELEGRAVSVDQGFRRLLLGSYRRRFAPVRGAGSRARRSAGAGLPFCSLHQQAGVAVEAAARSVGPESAVCRDLRRRHFWCRKAGSGDLATNGGARGRADVVGHHGR